jgi:hypothetical protein
MVPDYPLVATTPYEVRPLTKEESSVLIKIALMDKGNTADLEGMLEETRKYAHLIDLMEKRIAVFHLPKFEASALLVLVLIFCDTPARAVLALIETVEAYMRVRGEVRVDAEFIAMCVYPMGIYTEAGFTENWNYRKQPQNFDKGFNRLIVTR